MALMKWALPQLQRLLPVDEDSLTQIVTYSDTLPKDDAAEHLKNLLGDSPQALEFIATFNARRQPPPGEQVVPNRSVGPSSREVSESEVPRASSRPKKKKQPLNKPFQARQPENYGNVDGGYVKKDEGDYMTGSSKRPKERPLSNTLSLQSKPDAIQSALPNVRISTPPQEHTPRLPPSAAGPLISDEKSQASRDSSPAAKGVAKSKINVTGGTSMRGQSATLNDLDSSIRALEMQTNPTLATREDNAKRRCACMAQRHALLTAAPNCMNCGKIICAKEGLGPCTFCESPLLNSEQIQEMVRILKEERGKERQEANNASHKRAEVSKAPKPFSTPSNSNTPMSSAPASDSEDTEKLSAARIHRDKLLKFQADNARRTRIHDDAADFETPDSGLSLWASPQERALQLKKQQKVLREQEWNARPDYEKRRMVVSVDVVGGKAVKRMQEVERSEEPDSDAKEDIPEAHAPESGSARGGTFSRNPLMGGLIRPTVKADDKGKDRQRETKSTWTRVQDDNDDNEQWILDGGAYGDQTDGRVLGAEEHAFG